MSRVVLVLGASRGPGRATAHLLATRGDKLVLASRSALEGVAQECRDLGARDVAVVATDVHDPESVDSAVAGVVARHGRLDAVVLAADRTDARGAAGVARAALPVIRRQRQGHLVLVAPELGDWSVRALGRRLARDNRDLRDVQVSVVGGEAVTVVRALDSRPGIRTRLRESVRGGTPDDVLDPYVGRDVVAPALSHSGDTSVGRPAAG